MLAAYSELQKKCRGRRAVGEFMFENCYKGHSVPSSKVPKVLTILKLFKNSKFGLRLKAIS